MLISLATGSGEGASTLASLIEEASAAAELHSSPSNAKAEAAGASFSASSLLLPPQQPLPPSCVGLNQLAAQEQAQLTILVKY